MLPPCIYTALLLFVVFQILRSLALTAVSHIYYYPFFDHVGRYAFDTHQPKHTQGGILQDNFEEEKAIACFNRTILIDPDYADAHYKCVRSRRAASSKVCQSDGEVNTQSVWYIKYL